MTFIYKRTGQTAEGKNSNTDKHNRLPHTKSLKTVY